MQKEEKLKMKIKKIWTRSAGAEEEKQKWVKAGRKFI